MKINLECAYKLTIHNKWLIMPAFSQLETFILTSELGSLAKVAKKLGVSAAAVSKQLSRLEAEVGAQLLIRSTRHVALTEIGVSYCMQCKRVFEEMETASNLISNSKAIPHGILNVLSGRHFASSYIVPHVKEFLLKYPKIELNLELGERIPDLNQEGIDVLIGMSISATGEVIQKRIASTSYLFAASPEYLKKFGVPENPEDLKKHRYITHSMRVPDNELIFKRGKTILVKPFIRVNDAETMLKFALEGMGIVKLHHYVVKEYLEAGNLKEVLTAFKEGEIPIYVAFPQRRFISSKVRCFVDFIIKKMIKEGSRESG